jgi:TIR domain-containing protein
VKIFIGWSGERSKQIASALWDWLPSVVQAVKPWMSERDINSGARWLLALLDQLQNTDFGIVVLTGEIMREPWMHFEAGAVAKQLKGAALCPYLIDISDKSQVVGPLTQFQMKMANKEETFSLVADINMRLGEESLSDRVLSQAFERSWPDLEKAINSLPPESAGKTRRTEVDLLEEILERVRSMDRNAYELERLEKLGRGYPDPGMIIGLLCDEMLYEDPSRPPSDKDIEASLILRRRLFRHWDHLKKRIDQADEKNPFEHEEN